MVGGLQGWLRGVEVKQLLGLELGRSECTGVGLMRREGLVRLEVKQTKNNPAYGSQYQTVHLCIYYAYLIMFTILLNQMDIDININVKLLKCKHICALMLTFTTQNVLDACVL